MKFFLVLFLALMNLHHANLKGTVEESLKKVSSEDKFFLKIFFQRLFFHKQAGHVLFFDTKPACLGSIHMDTHRIHFLDKLEQNGWKAWKKNEHLFSHPRFIFTDYEWDMDGEKMLEICVINKQTLKTCLEENIGIFKEKLGEGFSPESFIAQVENEKKLRSLIKEDQFLLGIILGFGVEASTAFQEATNNLADHELYPPTAENYGSIDIRPPEKCHIFPIGFAGDPHSKETQELARIYTEELAQLWSTFKSSRNTLKLVLHQLCLPEEH